MQLPPFAQAQEAKELLVRPFAQLRLGHLLVRVAVGVPQREDAHEFRFRVRELRMRGICGGAGIDRAFARILHAQEAGDHQHLAQHAVVLGGDQHACQFHVHRQLGHGLADGGERALPALVGQSDRAEFTQLLPAIGDGARVWRLQKRELLDVPQAQRQHPQDHPGQRRPADFRIGVFQPRSEVRFGIDPQAHARRDPPAAAGALVGAGLADRFDMQAVQFLARAVALDPGHAGIDHIVDARHGQRSLGHVGGQHDPPLRAGMEHAVLVFGRQARVQRQDFGVAIFAPLQRLVRIADFALAGQEDQGVADALVFLNFVAGGDDAIEQRAFARNGVRFTFIARIATQRVNST